MVSKQKTVEGKDTVQIKKPKQKKNKHPWTMMWT